MEEYCKEMEDSTYGDVAGDIGKDWRTWTPDPIDANPGEFLIFISKLVRSV
jgi:hypothetical protein